MNDITSAFERISTLISSSSFHDKSIEIYTSIDNNIFAQLEGELSNLSEITHEELFSSKNDYLFSLLCFLLEHISLEINLSLLTSTQIDYHSTSSTIKIYKPNLIPTNRNIIQYTSQSQKILNLLFKKLRVNNLQEFLLLKPNSDPIYLSCLQYLVPFLSKTTYDKHPIALQVFVQIITSMNQSSLSETFHLIFPICLITLDDPSIDIKLISLYLLDHLQRNSTTTELLLYNRANVIMYGLEQNLHRRGDRIIFFECLLSTVYRWLNLLENEIYSGKHLFIRTSQLIERLIRDSLLEINIEYRRLLLKILRYYIIRLQLFSLRHLNHLFELVDDSIDNHLLRYDSLQILFTLLQTVKPRINVHRYDIMKIIIRCLFKIMHEDKDNVSILNLLKKCLKELQISTTGNYVQDALHSLIETSQLDQSYREFLQKFVNEIDEHS